MRTRTSMMVERTVLYVLIFLVLAGDVWGGLKNYNTYKWVIDKSRIAREKERKKEEENRKAYNRKLALLPRVKEDLKRHERNLEIVRKKWRKKVEELNKYLKIIPTYKNKPELIKKINFFAKKFNIILQDLSTSETKAVGPDGNIRKFGFSMKIEGRYENIKKFLWFVENMEIIVQMERDGFDILSLNNEDGNMVCSCKLYTYFFAR